MSDQNQNCTDCGHKLRMYYRKYCPICTKPAVVEVRTLNLLEALYHIVALDGDEDDAPDNFKNRFWKYLSPFSNNSYVSYWFGTVEEPEEYSEQQVADEKRFREVFSITEESIVFAISW